MFFWFLYKNMYSGYSLEVPVQGTSNEYPQYMFQWCIANEYQKHIFGEFRKISAFF